MGDDGLVGARYDLSEPIVALTFDDGPAPWTDPILDELDRHGCRGTFFVLGNAIDSDSRRRTIERIVAGGHELGNHTFTHPDLQTLDPESIESEMCRARERIEEVAGVHLRYWRAPFFRSGPAVRAAVGPRYGREVWYSCLPCDWSLPATETAERVLADLQPGAIVALHDGRPAGEPAEVSWPTREATVDAVRLVLRAMSERGLRSVTISELLDAG